MNFKDDITNTNKTAQDNRQFFEQVYLQYVKPVYYCAYGILHNREDAEDVTHQVFTTYFGLKDLEHVSNTKSYLLQIAKNKSLNYLKQKEREYLTDDTSIFDQAVCDSNNRDDAAIRKLKSEINLLPMEEQQVLILHLKAGMKFREIAKAMDLTVPAVYRRYKKAIRTLQNKMKGIE